MTRKQFDREAAYQAALAMARAMLAQGIITVDDFTKMERIFRAKFSPCIGNFEG